MKKLFICFIVVFMMFFAGSAFAVTLQWDKDTNPNIEGFTIYWGVTQGENYIYNKSILPGDLVETVDNEVDVVRYTIDDNLFEYGGTYYFVVQAYSEAGASGFSNEAVYNKLSYTPPADNLPDPVIIVVPSGTVITIVGGA